MVRAARNEGTPVDGGASHGAPDKGAAMIGTIVSAIIVGLIVGALGRLVMPGKQNIGIIMTTILGALGSLVGSWLYYQLGYHNANGGFKWTRSSSASV